MRKGVVTIQMGETVLLEDFSSITNEYIQLYGFFYSLRILSENPGVKLEHEQMSWSGGASVVSFFNVLTNYVHPSNRAVIKKIHFEATGMIKLIAIKDIAKDIANLIHAIINEVPDVATTYHLIHLHYQKSKLTRKKMKDLERGQKRDKIVFVEESVSKLHQAFGFNVQQIAALSRMAQADELVVLKMQMAIYRRVLPLVELQRAGKFQF